jgi:shikimate kinase
VRSGDVTPTEGRHVVLLGLMGCGKSSVAEALGARLDRSVWDNDRELRRALATSAVDLADASGLDELHRVEAGVLDAGLALAEPAVVTAAASLGDRADLPELLAGHLVVWLDVDPLVLAQRIPQGLDHRPLQVEAVTQLRAQRQRRAPNFRAAADLVLTWRHETPEDLATRIIDRFGLLAVG